MSARDKRSPPSLVIVRDLDLPGSAYAVRLAGNVADVQLREDGARLEEILGFGSWLNAAGGPVFVAYFSGIRRSAETAPAYDEDLWLVIGRELFDLNSPDMSLQLERGFSYRTLRVQAAGRTIASLDYHYSLLLDVPRLWSDPFHIERDVPELAAELSRSNKAGKSTP
jgi:hypothetical protein